jgi:hypothetical protein
MPRPKASAAACLANRNKRLHRRLTIVAPAANLQQTSPSSCSDRFSRRPVVAPCSIPLQRRPNRDARERNLDTPNYATISGSGNSVTFETQRLTSASIATSAEFVVTASGIPGGWGGGRYQQEGRECHGQPMLLNPHIFPNGLVEGRRCFCCFCRKLSATHSFLSAEILEFRWRSERKNSKITACSGRHLLYVDINAKILAA